MQDLYFKVFKNAPDLSTEGAICAEHDAYNVALGYISGQALVFWMYAMGCDIKTLHKANSEYFFEKSGFTEQELQIALQELKRKKYLCLLDEETNTWGLYEYPRIKGVWE